MAREVDTGEYSINNTPDDSLIADDYAVNLDSDYDLENSDNDIFLGEVDRLLGNGNRANNRGNEFVNAEEQNSRVQTVNRRPRRPPAGLFESDESEGEEQLDNDELRRIDSDMEDSDSDGNDEHEYANLDPGLAEESDGASEPEEDLCVDLDNLGTDDRDGDAMFEKLHKEAEWNRHVDQFEQIHVKQFNQPTGAKLPDDFDTNTASPIDYFNLFFTEDVLARICNNTNKYVQYLGNVKRRTNPRYVEKLWKDDVTVDELKAFFGIAIFFGLSNQKRYRLAWSNDPYFGNSTVKKIMPLRRYQKLWEYLHVSDRETEHARGHPQYDELAKVRWLIDHMNDAFPKYMHPQRHQSIDEGLIKFAGRCKFVQYNKAKPVKRGIKLWIRADSTRAYCQQFKIYLGKGSEPTRKNGVYFDVVWDLLKKIQGKQYCIFFDNLYSSIPLLRFLYSKGLYATGTIRKNSKLLPDGVKNCPKLERGQFRIYQSRRLSNLTSAIWWDTKEVRFVSTHANPLISGRTVRRVAGNHVNVTMPSVARLYGMYYGGVDRLDALMSKKIYGSIGHSTKKMWKHIFLYLINLSIANSYVLFKCTTTRGNPGSYEHFDFRLELVKELIGDYTGRKRRGPCSKALRVVGFPPVAGHQLCYMPFKASRRCKPHRVHQPNGKPNRVTVFGCMQCNQHMCAECFRLCHSDN